MRSADALLSECRTLAADGSWSELCTVAAQHLGVATVSPTLITLYAEALLRTGHPRTARRWLDEQHATLVSSGDRAAIRRGVNFAGAASFEQSDLDNARQAFERALELGRIDGDDLLVARATNNLAVISTIRGRHDEALGLYAIALPAYQRLGNVNGLAESYHNAAIALRKLNQLQSADEHEQRAAEFARQVHNEHLVALTLVGRAEISLLRGDAAMAEATAFRAAKELAAVKDPSRQADAIRLGGAARLALGKLVDACEALNLAVELAMQHGNTLIEAESRWTRAQASMALGHVGAALADAERAATYFEALNVPTELATVKDWLSRHGRPPS
ncbi:MAG: tetratricopeptide repeat protein [Gemmatimonadota bacterium]|nr:tetratricopeptide repeat protein [Gemmatimonadota bacterium]